MLYAESSAVLAWLLGETQGIAIADALREALAVVTSDLTLVECSRVLHREAARGTLTRRDADERRARLEEESTLWNVQAITDNVIARAREPFPDDAIRTLDAIHMASALVARSVIGDIDVLSLDERVRSNAVALGFRVLPV